MNVGKRCIVAVSVAALGLLSSTSGRTDPWLLSKPALQQYSETLRKRANHVCGEAWNSAETRYGSLRPNVGKAASEHANDKFFKSISTLSTCRATAAVGLMKAFPKIQTEAVVVPSDEAVQIARDVAVELRDSTVASSSALEKLEQIPWPLPEPSAWWTHERWGGTVGAVYDRVQSALGRAKVNAPPAICSLPEKYGGGSFALVSVVQSYDGCGVAPKAPHSAGPLLAASGLQILWSLLVTQFESIVPEADARRARIFIFVSTDRDLPAWQKEVSKAEAQKIFTAGSLCSPSPSAETRSAQLSQLSRLHVFVYEMAAKNSYDIPRKVGGPAACTPAAHQRDLGLLERVEGDVSTPTTPR